MAQTSSVPQQSNPPASPASGGGISIGDPAPLGLAGFGGTTLFLSVVNAGFITSTAGAAVLGLALFWGGMGQLIAGLWEFRRGNTFAGVAFCSYAGFWLSFWYLTTHAIPGLSAKDSAHATGLYLLIWAIFTLYMTVATFKLNAALVAVFVLLTLTFVFLAIANFAESTGITKVGGWLGILTAVAALYTSFAVVVNTTFDKSVLPVGPLG